MTGVRLGPLTADHWPQVREIYAAGIATGNATFESEPPTWEKFDAGKLAEHRLVALDDDGTVLGWVAASPVSDRCVYAGVVEHSVYVHPDARGRGVGRMLLDGLLRSTAQAGVWTVQSGVFPENVASLALHAAAGVPDGGHPPAAGAHELRADGRPVARRGAGGAPPAGLTLLSALAGWWPAPASTGGQPIRWLPTSSHRPASTAAPTVTSPNTSTHSAPGTWVSTASCPGSDPSCRRPRRDDASSSTARGAPSSSTQAAR